MEPLLAIVAAYLVGSVPFAFLLTRRRGFDLRRVGSGNVGAANVLRTSGVRAAVLAVCLDVVKGAVAVFVADRLAGGTAAVAAGVASVVGHVYPVWLRFRGGKGVATAAGAFVVLTPLLVGAASAVFLVTVWATRYVSVGSAAATLSLVALVVAAEQPITTVAGAVSSAAVILHGHRANFARLAAGTERRVGERLFEGAAR